MRLEGRSVKHDDVVREVENCRSLARGHVVRAAAGFRGRARCVEVRIDDVLHVGEVPALLAIAVDTWGLASATINKAAAGSRMYGKSWPNLALLVRATARAVATLA